MRAMTGSWSENRFYLLVGISPAIIFRSRISSTRDAVAPQTGGVVFGLLYFLKPSDDVRQVGGINRDNFKHFRDTPRCKSITFDSRSFANFPTGGAVSDMPIPDLGAATIDPTVVYTK